VVVANCEIQFQHLVGQTKEHNKITWVSMAKSLG